MEDRSRSRSLRRHGSVLDLILKGSFSVSGISIQISNDTDRNSSQTLVLDRAQALQLTNQCGPEGYGWYKQNSDSSLTRFRGDGPYALQEISEAKSGTSGKRSYVLQTSEAVFNFITQSWDPKRSVTEYLAPQHYLYVACKPLSGSLFCKLGYVSQKDNWNNLITYLEKKSKHLQLTNQADAYIFLLKVPDHFTDCASPGLAAKDALKNRFCNTLLRSDKIKAVPCDKEAERLADYRQDEWYIITCRDEQSFPGRNVPGSSALIVPRIYGGLLSELRDFSGDASLLPYKAVSKNCSQEGLSYRTIRTYRMDKRCEWNMRDFKVKLTVQFLLDLATRLNNREDMEVHDSNGRNIGLKLTNGRYTLDAHPAFQDFPLKLVAVVQRPSSPLQAKGRVGTKVLMWPWDGTPPVKLESLA